MITGKLMGAALLVAGLFVLPQGAQAQDGGFGLSEVRAGVMFHDAQGGLFRGPLEFDQLEDVTLEALFDVPILDLGHPALQLRPHLGATVSLTGQESLAHAGLTLTVQPFALPVFVEGALGAAVHTGSLGPAPGMRAMGCRFAFYEQFSVGVHLTDRHSVMATYEHTSNASLCSQNDGLTNIGLRFGTTFD